MIGWPVATGTSDSYESVEELSIGVFQSKTVFSKHGMRNDLVITLTEANSQVHQFMYFFYPIHGNLFKILWVISTELYSYSFN